MELVERSESKTEKNDAPSRESSVRQAGNVVSKSSTHDQTRRLKHLGHSRSSLGSKVSQDDDGLLSSLDRARLDGLDELVLPVERSRLTGEVKSLLSGDLGDGSSGCEVSSKDAGGHN